MNVHAAYARERPETDTRFLAPIGERGHGPRRAAVQTTTSDDTTPTAGAKNKHGQRPGHGRTEHEHDEQPEIHNYRHGYGG